MQLAECSFNPWYYIDNKKIENKNSSIGTILMLSGVPFSDSGGGQRVAQMSLEFIRQGYKVIFLNLYPSYEEKLTAVKFEVDLSLLELYSFTDFIENHLNKLKEITAIIIEFPHPAIINLLRRAKELRIKIIFDYIDNWKTSLGGDWYNEVIERDIIGLSDFHIASAPLLVNKLDNKCDANVYFIPNAFNQNIYNIEHVSFVNPYLKIFDNNNPVVLYSGALWGSWFDWDLVKYLIDNTDYNYCFIGGIDGYRRTLLSSDRIKFLGILNQIELPSYVFYSAVCIIPFKVDEITDYCNPLKIYEYIAMNKPVITTGFKGIQELPHVFIANSKEEFKQKITENIQNIPVNSNFIDEFTWNHSWKARIDKIRKVAGI